MTTPHPAVVAVAKAICEAYGANPNTPVMPEKASTGTEPKVPLWHDCVPHARHIIRAFLDATREPSEGMAEKAYSGPIYSWRAMHDQLRREALGDD